MKVIRERPIKKTAIEEDKNAFIIYTYKKKDKNRIVQVKAIYIFLNNLIDRKNILIMNNDRRGIAANFKK